MGEVPLKPNSRCVAQQCSTLAAQRGPGAPLAAGGGGCEGCQGAWMVHNELNKNAGLFVSCVFPPPQTLRMISRLDASPHGTLPLVTEENRGSATCNPYIFFKWT